MNEKTRAILEAADDVTETESPPGFDHAAAIARVRAVMPTLEQIAGLELEIDENVQDASFFCDVGHWRELQPRNVYPVILVRFSAFGSLVTITTADEIEPALVRRLAAALEAAGYTYVVAEELDAPYDGKHPHIGQSWWVRFFDYL